MKLYGIVARSYSLVDKETGDMWQQNSVGVGAEPAGGKNFREILVPVVGDVDESDQWAVIASRTGRPKIVRTDKSSPGIIMRLTSRRDRSKLVGEVFVYRADAPDITVLAHGINGDPQTGELWNEYLLMTEAESKFFIARTTLPNTFVGVNAGSDRAVVAIDVVEEMVDNRVYVCLANREVPKWRMEDHLDGKG